jgi:hypothetical protein
VRDKNVTDEREKVDIGKIMCRLIILDRDSIFIPNKHTPESFLDFSDFKENKVNRSKLIEDSLKFYERLKMQANQPLKNSQSSRNIIALPKFG